LHVYIRTHSLPAVPRKTDSYTRGEPARFYGETRLLRGESSPCERPLLGKSADGGTAAASAAGSLLEFKHVNLVLYRRDPERDLVDYTFQQLCVIVVCSPEVRIFERARSYTVRRMLLHSSSFAQMPRFRKIR